MRINPIFNYQTNFQGIKKPYFANGTLIYPIEKDLGFKDLEKIKKCISPERFIGRGLNGIVYKISDDYVVKISHKDCRVNDAIKNETKKLDILYETSKERNFDLQNSQRGITAFFETNGREYLVSTLVKGKKCDNNNPLNTENIDSMMKILTELDIGSKKFGRLMSYDYNGNNVNFTDKTAGIFDFEYLRGTPIDESIEFDVLSNIKSDSPHISDTSPLNSNVRTFEFGNLSYYLRDLPANKARETFIDYLNRKSLYHAQMADFYTKLAKTSKYKQILEDFARKEKIHSKLLSKEYLKEDIIKSEAIKIQIAEFIYRCGGSETRGKFNPEQILSYYDDSKKYFINAFAKAIKHNDNKKAVYYLDCMNLLNTWKNLKDKVSRNSTKTRVTKDLLITLDKHCSIN